MIRVLFDRRRTFTRDIANRFSFPVLIAILVAALFLALTRIWAQPPTTTSGETAHTWPIVVNLLQGRGYSLCLPQFFPFCNGENQVTAQREPLPVLVFAGVGLLTQGSLLAASFVNVIVYLATLLATFWLAQLVTNRFTALVAAALWALYIPALKLLTSISGDLMASLWTVLAVIALVYARRYGRWYYWILVGICVGCGALSRSVLVILAPTFVAGMLVDCYVNRTSTSVSWTRLVYRLACFVCAVGLTVMPWVARNVAVFGKPIIGSTLSGYSLYRQSYQLGSPHFLRYVDGPEAQAAVDSLIAHQPQLRGTENEAQFDTLYTRAAIDSILLHPARYLALMAYRGLMLWFDLAIPPSDQTGTGDLAFFVRIQQALLLALAIVGIRGRWNQMWPLMLSIIAVSVCYMAVNGMIRYTVPFMPLTIVLSAIGITSLQRITQSPVLFPIPRSYSDAER